jgi:hypothetical protein
VILSVLFRILTGVGAKEWAATQGIPVCDDKDLIKSKEGPRTHTCICTE